MRLQLLRAPELSPEHRTRWSEIRAGNAELCSPYFHPEFTRIVASVRSDVFVAVLDNGAAFFPHQRGSWRVGSAVGGPISDYHGLIAPPEFQCDVRELVDRCGLSVWDFDHLLASQRSFAQWHALTPSSPIIDLAQGATAGSAKLRADTERRRRKLEREAGPLEFEWHSLDPAVFAHLRSWKSAQYLVTGGVDLFAVPWVRAVLDKILAQEASDFCGVLSVLRAGGKPIAAHYGMRSGGILHYWFPAYDPEFGSYSPGMLLLIEMIDAAPAHGVSVIDLGKGDALYKQRLANSAVALAEGSVFAGRLVRAAREGKRQLEHWVRTGPLVGPARRFGQVIRRLEKARKFR